MYQEKTIGVVVPAYNEELLIGRVIETMPDYVDKIVIVNDCSKDKTSDVVRGYQNGNGNDKIELIEHEINQGVGGAIASGYKWCRDNDIDVAVVMAGDAQMDPDDLPALLDPVVTDDIDYAKGNRLFTGDAWNIIPRWRYLGNSGLSMLTKIASGYWHIADSQSGYTAINKRALETINWDEMYKRYGQPNDLLVRLNIYNFHVRDVPIVPVYNIGEKSGIKPLPMLVKLSWLVFRLFLFRIVQKYIIKDFHPLVLFYTLGSVLLLLNIPLIVSFFFIWSQQISVPQVTLLAILFCTISGLQLLLFAMLFDMESNKELKGRRKYS